MWRAIHSIGRGLRSVRPSQCCPQDCSEEGPSKYHNHHYHFNEASKAKAETLRCYSAASCRILLTVKKYDTCLRAAAKLHSRSCYNGSPGTESRGSAGYHPKCPPWHWEILQENNKLEEYYSEKEDEEKENRRDWEKTCHFEEWKEVLQSSPTLHALGWGSAAALTWSLYHDWNKLHPCLSQNKNEQQQASLQDSRKLNSVPKDIKNADQKNEETQNYHKPFKDSFAFESNITVSSEFNAEDYCKNYSRDRYKVPNLKYNFNSTNAHKLNMMPHNYSAQETVIPVYSLQQNFLDMVRKVFKNQRNDYVKEIHRLEEICIDENFHDTIKSPFPLESKWCNAPDKTDSGCISDSDQSLQSQTCSAKPEILQNHYSQNEESNITKLVSDKCPERPVTEASETELSAEEKDERKYYQSTAQNEPVNNLDDDEVKMLQDKLLKMVKAYHDEQLSDLLKNENTFLDNKPEEMIVYFQAGVLVGDSTSAFNLALCYHMGHGTTQDLEKARKLYEVASAAGHGWATYNLAVMLNQGLGGPFLPQKAHSLLLQAAKLGVIEAEEALSALEEEEDPRQTVSQEGYEPSLRQCYSEPCLLSALSKEWPLSYSTGDLHSLLDEDDWTAADTSTIANVSWIT